MTVTIFHIKQDTEFVGLMLGAKLKSRVKVLWPSFVVLSVLS